MSRDGTLPPGVSHLDIDAVFGEPERRRGEPKYLRCLGCMLDFEAGALDDDLLCRKCRQDAVNEDEPKEER